MPTISIFSRHINFEDSGRSGLPIILLHGFCEDLTIWDDLVHHLSDIRVIRLDLPGFGNTDLSPVICEDVKAVADHLSLTEFILLGHSMGGYVTLAFAEKYPQLLAGFGLINSYADADTKAKKQNRNKAIDSIKENGNRPFIRQLFRALFPSDYSDQQTIARLVERAYALSDTAIIHALEMMRDRPKRTAVLQQADCPVLFVIGEKDEIVPFDKSLEAAALPAVSDIHILPDTVHMSMFEAPLALANIVRSFYKMVTFNLQPDK